MALNAEHMVLDGWQEDKTLYRGETATPLNHRVAGVLAHGHICKQKGKHLKHKGDILETENFFHGEHTLSKVNTEASLITTRPCCRRKWGCQAKPLFTEHNLIT